MNAKLSYSLTFAIIYFNKLEIRNIDQISVFINSQMAKMPDHFSFLVKVASVFFEIIILLIFLKRFHNLTSLKKVKVIDYIKRVNTPFLSLLIRFFESNALLKYFELNFFERGSGPSFFKWILFSMPLEFKTLINPNFRTSL